jgi:hypothetical protein
VAKVVGGALAYRRAPCAECPWRVDRTGAFPASAFRASAPTAYDMAPETFACHMSGTSRPAICAGFLLRGAEHNLAVRLRLASGEIALRAVRSRVALHSDYRSMAVANGVDPDDPALAPCRGASFDPAFERPRRRRR